MNKQHEPVTKSITASYDKNGRPVGGSGIRNAELFLNDYYTGWTPDSYSRTEAFLRSAVKVDAHPYQGGVKASVYIDLDI